MLHTFLICTDCLPVLQNGHMISHCAAQETYLEFLEQTGINTFVLPACDDCSSSPFNFTSPGFPMGRFYHDSVYVSTCLKTTNTPLLYETNIIRRKKRKKKRKEKRKKERKGKKERKKKRKKERKRGKKKLFCHLQLTLSHPMTPYGVIMVMVSS